DVNALAFDNGCPRYLGDDGGMFVATNDATHCGTTWGPPSGASAGAWVGTSHGGLNALQIYELSGQVRSNYTNLYIGTQDNLVFSSPTDNGYTWALPALGALNEGGNLSMAHRSDI